LPVIEVSWFTGAAARVSSGATVGRVKVKRVPPPGFSVAAMVPPWRVTMRGRDGDGQRGPADRHQRGEGHDRAQPGNSAPQRAHLPASGKVPSVRSAGCRQH
jgi:hypothetical protein